MVPRHRPHPINFHPDISIFTNQKRGGHPSLWQKIRLVSTPVGMLRAATSHGMLAPQEQRTGRYGWAAMGSTSAVSRFESSGPLAPHPETKSLHVSNASFRGVKRRIYAIAGQHRRQAPQDAFAAFSPRWGRLKRRCEATRALAGSLPWPINHAPGAGVDEPRGPGPNHLSLRRHARSTSCNDISNG